jgi:hypothetical protein
MGRSKKKSSFTDRGEGWAGVRKRAVLLTELNCDARCSCKVRILYLQARLGWGLPQRHTK